MSTDTTNSASPTDAFLGVEKSLMGRRWSLRESDERTAMMLSQRLGVAEVIGRVLNARGISIEEATSFLEPTLKDLLPDPHHLKDMDVAAERLASAIMQGEQIAVFGDYDVDGATSSALLKRFFDSVGATSKVVIPDRIKDGYGPNTPGLLKLREEGASVVVTVDCGTTSFEPLAAASEAGLDVIVVDHHVAEVSLPKAVAVVNPNRLDDDSPHGQMAAVGVTFLLVVAVNRALRQADWYESRGEPSLMQWLDLVALGTICDVVPLKGVNRALVTQGLKVMAERGNPGLVALADVAGIDEPPGAYHAGFVLGPRINAGGRVGESAMGSRLLSCNDKAEAAEMASSLDKFNKERQDIEAKVLQEASEQVDAGDPGSASIVIAAGEGWHPGVVGIVASRLKERFDRPSLVIALNEGVGTGSGRSVSGVDLGSAVIAARQAEIIQKGGGHAMAAGLTVEVSRLDDLKTFLNERLGDVMAERPAIPGYYVDGALKVAGANMALVESLAKLGPFGSGNAEPRFVITNARVAHADPVGHDQSHLRLSLTDETGKRLNCIAFRAVDTDMGQALIHHGGAPFHVAGKIRINTWQGRSSAQLLVDDAAAVW
ncbi:MAG: single-stranded-DNA-specific exonuclease RecJ [Rhodospirillaceae bacterium]|jgi:single-stranded-DNA-specific exonuclease|nr:single-stranded-DNA-specific exonuclease RecJ [Rhodospirillaceae bacterium]MBT5561849.1 single-stranded-DNA-specific exonuclease RecJ [Rhodospirillaceae bacterium]MBT6240963.1 single-stranded-DNA-specific exonuclease RecJ [Rhodospirillaceae bacterium]MBT7138142.1 single-stranded-DNA-specific exonuclease RecJ [Rhodospirillaceae bacterium]